jgi:uncharacterized membrane protein affecting hemolysin expression
MNTVLSVLNHLKEYANVLVAIAALLAVLIGPSIQAFGAIRQGRSQAISNLSTALITEAVNQVSRIILLASEYQSSDWAKKNDILRGIYHSEAAVILIMGQKTAITRRLESSLRCLREALHANKDGHSIEKLINDINEVFFEALAEERKNIRSGK